jgi:multiple antibiotic resistance protein
MTLTLIIESTLYFLALINPASKVFLLSSMNHPYSWRELRSITVKSNIAALLILLAITEIGSFLLKVVFHVEIYSLKVAGGIVLFIIGLTAVRQGRFFEKSIQDSHSDISIVPLAAPLIAGPGTITAAIAYASNYGEAVTLLSLTVAVFLNFLIMLGSKGIGEYARTALRHRAVHPHHRAHRCGGRGTDGAQRTRGMAPCGDRDVAVLSLS